jgi:hypothetical protein
MTHEELYSAVRAMTPERFNVSVDYSITSYGSPEFSIISTYMKTGDGLCVYGDSPELALMEYAKRIARLWEAK